MPHRLNHSGMRERRRQLRNNPTTAEKILWRYLRKRQIEGIKFRRQYSVGSYVIDFYAPSIRLGIEVDGDSHFRPDSIEKDRERMKYLEGFGIGIVRFQNDEVLNNIDGVYGELISAINKIRRTTP